MKVNHSIFYKAFLGSCLGFFPLWKGIYYSYKTNYTK